MSYPAMIGWELRGGRRVLPSVPHCLAIISRNRRLAAKPAALPQAVTTATVGTQWSPCGGVASWPWTLAAKNEKQNMSIAKEWRKWEDLLIIGQRRVPMRAQGRKREGSFHDPRSTPAVRV